MARIFSNPRGPHRLLQSGELDLSPVRETSGAPAIDRVSVYADAYFSRLKENLDGDYELARKWIGEEAFHDLRLSQFSVGFAGTAFLRSLLLGDFQFLLQV